MVLTSLALTVILLAQGGNPVDPPQPDPNAPPAGQETPSAAPVDQPPPTNPTRDEPAPAPILPREIELPFDRLGPPVISPNGDQVALTVLDDDNRRQIYLVSADGGTPTAIAEGPYDNFSPAYSPDGRKLAYVSSRSGNADIWIVGTGGGPPRQVTDDPSDDVDPAWSPDGKLIAFSSDRSGSMLLYLATVSEKQVYPVTSGPGPDRHPSWSSDGQWLAFEARVDREAHPAIIPATGGVAKLLDERGPGAKAPFWTPDGQMIVAFTVSRGRAQLRYYSPKGEPVGVQMLNINVSEGDTPPSVSHDGKRLAYIASGGSGLGIINLLKGGAGQSLTEGGLLNRHPTWLPDGRHLVFSSDRDGWQDLYGLNVSTGRLSRITSSPEVEADPRCSPVGGDIAFSLASPAGAAIWLLEPQTGRRIRITGDEMRATEPAWSPDGRSIAFTSDREGSPDLYVANVGDGSARRITSLPGVERHPAWSPDGKWLAFSRDDGSGSDIWKIPVDGGQMVRLTNLDPGTSATDPDWAANDGWIAFTYHSAAGTDVYMVPAKGGRVFPYLRPKETDESHPAWAPDSAHMAYEWAKADRLMILDLAGD